MYSIFQHLYYREQYYYSLSNDNVLSVNVLFFPFHLKQYRDFLSRNEPEEHLEYFHNKG